MTTQTTTVDIKLTWKGVMPYLITLLEDGSEKGKAYAREELTRLANHADTHNLGIVNPGVGMF